MSYSNAYDRWLKSDVFLRISSLDESPNEVHSFKRPVNLSAIKSGDSGAQAFFRGGLRSATAKQENCVGLIPVNQVVRALPPNKVPLKELYPKGQSSPYIKVFRKYKF